MAAKTQTLPPFPRFSRLTLGLSLKSHSLSPRPGRRSHQKRSSINSDDWYIPYNGPYEKRLDVHQKFQPRDSWGDLITADEDDAILGDKDLHNRYGTVHDKDWHYHTDDGLAGPRIRATSGVSHQTGSSAAIDPYRNSTVTKRRSTISHPNPRHHTVSSYVSMDASGGVGESPMPPQRLAHPPQSAGSRGPFANFFSFNTNTKKGLHSHSKSPLEKGTDKRSSAGTSSPLLRKSSSSERKHNNPTSRTRREIPPVSLIHDTTSPLATDDEEYYHSYYSRKPNRDDHRRLPVSSDRDMTAPVASSSQHQTSNQHQRQNLSVPSNTSPQSSTSLPLPQLTRHPYAYVFPSDALNAGVHTAPVSVTRRPSRDLLPAHQRILLNASKRPSTGAIDPPKRHLIRSLKPSISSPNLRTTTNPNAPEPPNPSTKSKSSKLPRDRWFTVETLCDAILFPRPRFTVRGEGTSPMIVSPPESPLVLTANGVNTTSFPRKPPGIQSRVLLHSRSVADIQHRPAPEAGPSSFPTIRRRIETSPNEPDPEPPFPREVPASNEIRHRPKSFAQDDLALPSPVPSLTTVLQEGQQLEEMRKQWRSQAIDSFQNKRTRSISRTRSKSLTSTHSRVRRKEGDGNKVSESIDFLAERTFLGNQIAMPAITLSKPTHKGGEKSTATTLSSRSHSHSNSKTSSKASGQRGHSRNGSWSQSARKMAASLCGLNGDASPLISDDEQTALDGVLKGNTTKVIVLADPAADGGQPNGNAVDFSPPDARPDVPYSPDGASPAPSGSFEGVGIALSTPPPLPEGYDNDPITLPDHPYAQASSMQGSSMISSPHHESIRGSDYAGPHPSSSSYMASIAAQSDVSSRHRLPPHATLHPYAQTSSSRDSYQGVVPNLRFDSDVPPPAKMWVHLSREGLQEILPSEIQYSPFSPPTQEVPGVSRVQSVDAVSIGEALNYSIRRGPGDSGFGTSEVPEFPPQLIVGKAEGDRQSLGEGTSVALHSPLKVDTFPIGPIPRPAVTNSSPELAPSEFNLASPEAEVSGVPSQSSSPQVSPRPLGGMDDLDHFRDLFYRPSLSRMSPIEMMPPPISPHSREPSLTWDITSRRTGSGLTSLARQLSDELDELNAQMEMVGTEGESQGGGSGGVSNGLRFVLTEGQETRTNSTRETSPLRLAEKERAAAFRPSENIPEDVASSRASSMLERSVDEEEDSTQIYRVGVVGTVVTPPATESDHRISGHLSLVDEDTDIQAHDDGINVRKSEASLVPPSATLTRSSYMTSSTNASRMSGLSDFPIPPSTSDGAVGDMQQADHHIKLYDSLFDGPPRMMNESRSGESPQAPMSRRMTFGGDEDIEDIAKALSAP